MLHCFGILRPAFLSSSSEVSVDPLRDIQLAQTVLFTKCFLCFIFRFFKVCLSQEEKPLIPLENTKVTLAFTSRGSNAKILGKSCFPFKAEPLLWEQHKCSVPTANAPLKQTCGLTWGGHRWPEPWNLTDLFLTLWQLTRGNSHYQIFKGSYLNFKVLALFLEVSPRRWSLTSASPCCDVPKGLGVLWSFLITTLPCSSVSRGPPED